MPLSNRFRVNAGLAFAMTLVLAAGLLAFVSTDRTLRIRTEAIRSQDLISHLNGLLASLEAAETSQRGYLLTSDTTYREDYHEAAARAQIDLEELTAHRGSEVSSSNGIEAVHRLTLRRLGLLARVSETFETAGFAAASTMVRGGEGSQVMDSLRRAIMGIEQAERASIAVNAREGLISERATRGLLLLMMILGVAVISLAVLLVNRDVDQRVRTESELRRAVAAADSANRTKSEFLATVSHEIRTPLNAILGMTELLRETQLNAEQEEFSRTVHSNAEALVALVGDLLDSFKIEAGQVDLEQVPFDVREVVEGVGEILMVRAEARDVDLAVYLHPDVPRSLVGDPNRLRQILLNLVSNAIKFTEKGEVSMVAACRPADNGRTELVVRVADTGIGIAADALERIFEPFVQAESSTTRRFGGTGLGLNIVRSLVDLMGGSVSVESTVGAGSVFTVVVPFDVDPTVHRSLPDLRGVDVALLSANEVRSEGIRLILASAGATVSVADDPDALQAVVHRRPQAVVILDEHPRFPVLPLAAAIRAAAGGQAKVVALCGLQSPVVSNRGDDIVDCVFKPVREARLLETVADAAGRMTPEGSVHAVPAARRARSGPPPRVLVAEDNFGNWLLAMRALTAAGYVADQAVNGQVAVERVAAREYDLIFMDIEMPVLDGLEATRAIRRLEQSEKRDPVPIVAVTAHALEGFREKCILAGMDDFTTKPVKPGHLVELAEQWIDPRPVLAVADDAPENHVLIRHFLRGEPFRVVSAHGGREALSMLERRRVSVMLLDMDMPDVTGYQVIAEIRRDTALRDLPVIAITGYTGADERARCLAAGCTEYLAKPFRRSELISSLRNALDIGSRDASPAASHPVDASASHSLDSLRDPVPAAARRGGEPEGEPGDPDRVQRERIARIVRLLNRRDFAECLPLVGELRNDLERAGDGQVVQFARALETAVAGSEEQSAVFWSTRVAAALRERERVRRLRKSGLLDSPPEARYDRLVRNVADRLHVPTALISLVDADRQFFKSQVGVAEPFASGRGTPLSYSFCQHVVSAAEPLIVEDARDHPIVRDNLAVPELGVISYAGVPLLTDDGLAMGSLCAVDSQPRKWSEEELDFLRRTARMVEAEMRRQPETPSPTETGATTAAGDPPRHASVAQPPPAATSADAPLPAIDPAEDPELAAFSRTFLRDRAEDAAKVETWLSSESWTEIIRLGHQLKGSAATFGFPKVGEIGARLESAARAADPERVLSERDALIAQLEHHRREG